LDPQHVAQFEKLGFERSKVVSLNCHVFMLQLLDVLCILLD